MSNKSRLQKLDEHRREVHKDLLTRGIFQGCLNCEHWDKNQQWCGQYRQVPPPEIITYGCPDWFMEIPF